MFDEYQRAGGGFPGRPDPQPDLYFQVEQLKHALIESRQQTDYLQQLLQQQQREKAEMAVGLQALQQRQREQQQLIHSQQVKLRDQETVLAQHRQLFNQDRQQIEQVYQQRIDQLELHVRDYQRRLQEVDELENKRAQEAERFQVQSQLLRRLEEDYQRLQLELKAAQPAQEKLQVLEKSQAALEQELSELRLEAERNETLENELKSLRQRRSQDEAHLRRSTREEILNPLLDAYDSANMALSSILHHPESGHGSVLDGMKMILKDFTRSLKKLGIEVICTAGEAFDPHVHEAMKQEASGTVPAGHVIRQWRCGFRDDQGVIRPAGVVVSSGKEEGETQ